MSSDDSSSDSNGESDTNLDMEQENSLRERVTSMRNELNRFPASYDTHVELISVLRTLGDLNELRQARETMNAIYPLSPQLWLDWIEDERKIAVTDDEKRKIECLFKRAIDDYDDISIWTEYCLFAIGNLQPSSAASIEATEEVFQSALMHQGLNVARANCLWDAYRDFLTVLHQYDSTTSEPSDKYLKQIDKLYQRQLRIPLIGMDQTLEAYKDFRTNLGASLFSNQEHPAEVASDCMEPYREAESQLQLLIPFEDKIEELNQDQAECVSVWSTYLDWIVSHPSEPGKLRGKASSAAGQKFSPNHVCCLFERAVTSLCLHPAIWLKFVDFLEDHLSSDKQRALHVLARSVRNCPWSIDLWLRYALLSECWALDQLSTDATNGMDNDSEHSAQHSAFAKVDAVYECALSAGLDQPADVLKLWLAYVDSHLRRLLRTESKLTASNPCLETLRSLFERAKASLHEAFGNEADPEAIIDQYNAFVEAKHVGDLGRARSIWTHLMQQPGRGSQSRFWLAYLQFERNWGDAKHLLRVTRMAINSISSDSTDHSFDAILRLVSEAGLSVSHYHELVTRVRRRRVLLAEEADSKPATVDAQKVSSPTKRLRETRKRKPSQSSELDSSTTAKHPKKQAGAIRSDSDPASAITTQEPKPRGEFVPHDPSRNDRTVFVSNLDYAATEDDLSKTFAECGAITSVRLVRDYAGRSKGYAYVEFQSADAAAVALGKDRHPLNTDQQQPDGTYSRPMFVSVCDPSRTKTTGFHYRAGEPEPHKLFVRNLDRNVTKHALQELFGQHGTVVDVRVATFRNGAPKGHAYVEFADAQQASRALVATDGLLVGDKQISVAISNPPVRSGAKAGGGGGEKSQPSEFKAPGIPTPRTHARTQLSFLPRAISRHDSTDNSSTGESANTPQQETQAKSNADFRNMFLKK